MTDQAAFPIRHELGERSPVESTLDGRLRIVDPEQLDVVGAEADEGVVSAAVLMPAAEKDLEAQSTVGLDGKVRSATAITAWSKRVIISLCRTRPCRAGNTRG